jgi:DNA-binding NtrC family response regulator
MRQAPKVLIADTREEARSLLASELGEHGIRVAMARTADEAIRLGSSGEFQCVVADFQLPGADCRQMVTAIRTSSPTTQVIVVDGEANTRTYLEVMEEGAFDYFPPDAQAADLVRQIRHAVGVGRGEEEPHAVDD